MFLNSCPNPFHNCILKFFRPQSLTCTFTLNTFLYRSFSSYLLLLLLSSYFYVIFKKRKTFVYMLIKVSYFSPFQLFLRRYDTTASEKFWFKSKQKVEEKKYSNEAIAQNGSNFYHICQKNSYYTDLGAFYAASHIVKQYIA